MKKILIIGANGFIGSHLARYYSKHNDNEYSITLACRDISTVDLHSDHIHAIELDVLDKKHLQPLLSGYDVIYNFAGHSGALSSFYNYNQNLEVNCRGMLNILDTVKDFENKPLIVFPSTRLVYGHTTSEKVNELFTPQPNTIYGSNKLAAENYLQSYSNLFDIPYLIFRISIPYGLFDTKETSGNYGFINYFINRALNGDPIQIYGDGTQKRDIIYIQDLVSILYKSVHEFKLRNNILNLGGTEVISVGEIADLVANKFGTNVNKINWTKELERIETGDMVLDSSALYSQIGFTPQFKLKDYLQIMRGGEENA
ncbi:NAD-dependent epimerase/dehydratase family protein [Aquibacillus halophilus]|uniref:NAD-dependent epimerase/dehydratase family protein n=1 Tax=Aquibacillus halophilus TaxID=930132 RepID=UPI0014790B9C|nr:NAD(P)-dependent oxidoreductase [Aquibacillus halophilus]